MADTDLPPSSGRDPELFVNVVDPELLCSICHNVFFDPLDTPCQHTFCQPCIRRALGITAGGSTAPKSSCPKCRSPITSEDQLKPVNYTLKNIMGRMVTRCDHAFQKLIIGANQVGQGCPWQGEWSQLASHLKGECEYQPVGCPFSEYGCPAKTIPRVAIKDHLCANPVSAAQHFEILAQALSTLTSRVTASESTIDRLERELTSFRLTGAHPMGSSSGGSSGSGEPLVPPKYGCYSHTFELVDFPPRNRPLEFHLGGFTWGLFFIEGAVAYAPFIRLVALHPLHKDTPSITVEWRVVIKGNRPNSNPTTWNITKDVFKVGTAWGPKTGCKTEQEFMDKAGVDLTLDIPFKVSLKLYIHSASE